MKVDLQEMERRCDKMWNRIRQLTHLAPEWIKASMDYWRQRIPEHEMGVDWEDAGAMCWRCARLRRQEKKGPGVVLEKCHIIPQSRGGTDGPENIIPLCRACHDEMPNVSNAKAVWDWIKEERATFYGGSFWTDRALNIAKTKGFDINLFNLEKYQRVRGASANHFGGQNVNTIVWCLLEACRPDQQAPQAEQVQP